MCRYANDSKASTALKKIYSHGLPLHNTLAALERLGLEDRSFSYGENNLYVSPAPSTAKSGKLHKVLPANQFSNLKFSVLERAQYVCECCGATASELHARYEYEEVSRVQTLKRLMAVCTACEKVSNYDDVSTNRADRKEVLAHLAKVEGMSVGHAKSSVEQALTRWRKRGSTTGKWFTKAELLQKRGLGLNPKFKQGHHGHIDDGLVENNFGDIDSDGIFKYNSGDNNEWYVQPAEDYD